MTLQVQSRIWWRAKMHASSMLRLEDFVVHLNGETADHGALLPHWSSTDRVGIVSHGPFDALGASLLVQLAVAKFYDIDPTRRGYNAQYPPIFLFHVGEHATGDHSSLDFWPPRREVRLPADPYVVLGAIRDRAVTRLIVPDVGPHGMDYVQAAPSGWTDVHSAIEQTVSAFAYAADGHLRESDVSLSTISADPERMVRDVLETERVVADFESKTDQELLDLELGPSTPSDLHGWLAGFRQRAHEVPAELRRELLDERGDGLQPQRFRRLSTIAALTRLVPESSSTRLQ